MSPSCVFCRFLPQFLIVWGVCLIITSPYIFDYAIREMLELSPKSNTFEYWRETEQHRVDFYFFNWTNPEEIFNSDIKPHFQELGPYRFWKVREKVDIVYNDNGTYTYNAVDRYKFAEEQSPGQLDDIIQSINIVATTAAYQNRFFHPVGKLMLSLALTTRSKLFTRQTIGELLFDGYYDTFLSTFKPISPFLSENIENKFSLLKNNSITGKFNMFTQTDENYGKLHAFNDRIEPEYFEGNCRKLQGSAGDLLPMGVERTHIDIFINELCSNTQLDYVDDVVVDGLQAYEFNGQNMFNFENPSRSCFCTGECMPYGALNISNCRQKSPVFISHPHFYNAHPFYTSVIDGMNPVKEKHEFLLHVEPKSSVIFNISARAQVNILLQHIPGFGMFDRVPTLLVPIFYLDVKLLLPNGILSKLYIVQQLPFYIYVFCGMLTSFGATLSIWRIYRYYTVKRKTKEDKTNVYKFEN